MADSGLEQSITQGKIGKVPVWGVGVGLAAVFIIFMYLRSRKTVPTTAGATSSDPTAVDPNAIDPATGLPYAQDASTNGAIGTYLGSDPTNPAFPVGMTPQGLPAPVTNIQWSRLVFDELIAKGDDPALVENALTKYLAGISLSPAEQAVINLAQQMFGAPPEGLVGVSTGGTTGTTSGGGLQTGVPGPVSSSSKLVSTAHVTKGWHVDEWITDMNTQGYADGLTYTRLVALNPQIAANIVWHSNSALNTFKADADYRVM